MIPRRRSRPVSALTAAILFALALPAFAATPQDEQANCGKRLGEAIQKFTQSYATALGSCYTANLALNYPVDCRRDERTAALLRSARDKLATATGKCSETGLDLLCPLEQKTATSLYDVLALDPDAYEKTLDGLLDAMLRPDNAPSCVRPVGPRSKAAQDCSRTLAVQVPRTAALVAQCLSKCEVVQTKSGGLPCIDPATGAVIDAKALDCISRARARLDGALPSRCSTAPVVELGCPLGANTGAGLLAAIGPAIEPLTTGLNEGLFHAACRTIIPIGLVDPTATATLQPSGTPVTVTCGQVLDAAFFGDDTGLVLGSDLDCYDAGATDGLVIATSGVVIDLGDRRVSGPSKSSDRTGIGIRIHGGADDVVVKHGQIQKFVTGVADEAGSERTDVTEISVRSNAGDGVVLAGFRSRVDTTSAKENGGVGIRFTGSNGRLTGNTMEDNASHGAVVSGYDNLVDGNSFGNQRDRGNGGFGLVVTAAGNTVTSNSADVNAQGGFLLQASAAGLFKANSADQNGGPGFRFLVGGTTIDSNRSERNTGWEYEIAASNNDAGNNRANGSVFAFTIAGGTFGTDGP